MEWDEIPKPVSRIDEWKKLGSEFLEAFQYYITHLNEIGDNEWGFFAFGWSAGAIMCIMTYFIVITLLGSPTPPAVPDAKKTN